MFMFGLVRKSRGFLRHRPLESPVACPSKPRQFPLTQWGLGDATLPHLLEPPPSPA